MKKTLLAVMLLTPLIANAGTVGTPTPKTVNVSFAAPNSYIHTLTAVTGLLAGETNTALRPEIATGQVSSSAGTNSARYAVQFAAGGSNTSANEGLSAVIKGNNNALNTLNVIIESDPSMPLKTTVESVNGKDWLVYPIASTFKYSVRATNTTIAADTYPITVNAAVFTP